MNLHAVPKTKKTTRKKKEKEKDNSQPRYQGSSLPSRSMRGGLLAMIKVCLGACAALLVLVSWGLVVLFVLGSSGWRVGVFGVWSAVLGSYPIWGIVYVKALITKRPSSFSSFQHARGRGTHTDSSANKAGLYVVRISLGTLSDVPAILHVQTQRCVQHI